MKIRIKETGEVMQEHELRELHPNVSGPLEFLYDVVLEGVQPTGEFWQYAVSDGVEQIDGKWYTKYSLGPVFESQADEDAYIAGKTAERMASVRAERNQKLAATDWRFRSDMDSSQEWKDYCQALRNVTNQAGFPNEIEWPVEPTN